MSLRLCHLKLNCSYQRYRYLKQLYLQNCSGSHYYCYILQ